MNGKRERWIGDRNQLKNSDTMQELIPGSFKVSPLRVRYS
jgi:hypothetical protein